MANCQKCYQTTSSLKGHQTKKHSAQDIPIDQPSAIKVENFKRTFLTKFYRVLGATPRMTSGKNRSGRSLKTGEMPADRDTFVFLFRDFATFKYSPDLQNFEVIFEGREGMRQMEAIFGQHFWKFAFPTRDYTHVLFWERALQGEKAMKFRFNFKTKAVENLFPTISFSFKLRRDTRTAQATKPQHL